MMVHIGRTLLGGALVASLVFASGAASGAASASGQCEVIKFVAGQAQAGGEARGYGRRLAAVFPSTAQTTATVLGAPAVEYQAAGMAATIAEASGRARADFCGYGQAQAAGGMWGAPVRTVRLRPPAARATATGIAEGYIYELAYGRPALARATAYGTTYVLGYGLGDAIATGEATPLFEAGGAGHAQAGALASGGLHYEARGLGQGNATAAGWADAAVIRNGVREFECFGMADATASGRLTHLQIYQSQTGRAGSSAMATAVHTVGAAGQANARAQASGQGLVIATGVTGEPANVHATAQGRAHYLAGAVGYGMATAQGEGQGVVIQTRAFGTPAQASAAGRGTCLRLAGGGEHHATGQAAGNEYGNRVTHAAGQAKATAAAQSGATHLLLGPQTATAQAWASAAGRRAQLAGGEAMARAEGVGSNQVNDLSPAPDCRTLTVGTSPRFLAIAQQPRLITVLCEGVA